MHKTCLVIPTYNNPETIQEVVKGVLPYSLEIIIVDDGSDRPVETILDRNEKITVIRLNTNKGKGIALKTGAEKALEKGYEYIITMDADTQHYPDDLVQFQGAFSDNPNEIIIGVRDFETTDVPKSSKFGRWMGNFWVWVECGTWIEDTQSGFRLYPISAFVKNLNSVRYELEVEILVKHVWSGGKIGHVPIQTIYPENRVTHFDKLKDNLIMTLLHAGLVIQRIFLLKGIFN